jgi:hypothetical protein
MEGLPHEKISLCFIFNRECYEYNFVVSHILSFVKC